MKKKYFFLIKFHYLFILLLAFTINDNYLSADQSIVLNDSAKSFIPKGIEFSIDLLSKESIDDIQIKFKGELRDYQLKLIDNKDRKF